jgi:hypothetical protein
MRLMYNRRKIQNQRLNRRELSQANRYLEEMRNGKGQALLKVPEKKTMSPLSLPHAGLRAFTLPRS